MQNGASDIPGRTWSAVYNAAQLSGTPPTGVDFSTWYQSEYGYLYQVDYIDYNGILSVLSASGVGIVNSGGGCVPIYKSVNGAVIDSSWAYAPSSCNSSYKLFYENPASDLPASATQWDGNTDWVKPAIANPAISNLGFSPTTTNSRDGNITFDLANFTGPVDVNIDTNNNGSYADPGDVTITYGASPGAVSVPFDGKDGNGDDIPNNQAIKFKASISKTAEIHFLMEDVELVGGGIQINRLNGPSGNETTIYWDDTQLAFPGVNRCSGTPQQDGTAGVDSTGGVHGWTLSGCGSPNYGNYNNYTDGSWGDARTINNWAFVATNTNATYTLSAFTTTPTPDPEAQSIELADTGQGEIIPFLISCFLVTVTILVSFPYHRFSNRKFLQVAHYQLNKRKF